MFLALCKDFQDLEKGQLFQELLITIIFLDWIVLSFLYDVHTF